MSRLFLHAVMICAARISDLGSTTALNHGRIVQRQWLLYGPTIPAHTMSWGISLVLTSPNIFGLDHFIPPISLTVGQISGKPQKNRTSRDYQQTSDTAYTRLESKDWPAGAGSSTLPDNKDLFWFLPKKTPVPKTLFGPGIQNWAVVNAVSRTPFVPGHRHSRIQTLAFTSKPIQLGIMRGFNLAPQLPSLLLGSLSLISNDTLRYTLLAITVFLTLIYLKRPSIQLGQLEDMIEETEGIIQEAKLYCARDLLSLTEKGVRLLQVKRSASVIQCRILETTTLTWNKYRVLSGDIAECAKMAKNIQTAVQLILQAERQHKLTHHINETGTIFAGGVRSLAHWESESYED
ncbi:hypothetical protein C8R44DRAFT_726784 [Mycena epipterygia]|nr:hypothetical protein C8R44DRAFT_726784 [Mycena epipterygia]